MVAREAPVRALGVFPGERAIRLVSHDPPALGAPTDVRVRVSRWACAAPCEICRFEFGTPPAVPTTSCSGTSASAG